MCRLKRNPTMMRTVVGLLVAALVVVIPVLAEAQSQDVVTYYHTDAIGSVRMITDVNGGVLTRYDYEPFGVNCAPNPPCVTQPPETRQFAGKERDVDTGFDYFGARYYEAVNGRFSAVDPLIDFERASADPQ